MTNQSQAVLEKIDSLNEMRANFRAINGDRALAAVEVLATVSNVIGILCSSAANEDDVENAVREMADYMFRALMVASDISDQKKMDDIMRCANEIGRRMIITVDG